jgi:ketosteroid isomerase-like protein
MSATDDLVAIQQLLARHNTAVDSGDGPEYADTWTRDGSSVTPNGTTTGWEALTALANSVPRAVPGIRHLTTNHLIRLDGDSATATVYLVATAGHDPTRVLTTGHYADELHRTADGWRFARRVFTPDGTL